MNPRDKVGMEKATTQLIASRLKWLMYGLLLGLFIGVPAGLSLCGPAL